MQPQPGQDTSQRETLKQQIAELEAQLADLKARLPAHTIPPAMIAEFDEIDEALEQAHRQLAAIKSAG